MDVMKKIYNFLIIEYPVIDAILFWIIIAAVMYTTMTVISEWRGMSDGSY